MHYRCVLKKLFLVADFQSSVEFYTSDSSCTLFVKRYSLATLKLFLLLVKLKVCNIYLLHT